MGAINGVAALGDEFRDWIADGGVVYIPLISEMYKLATGGQLKLGKALFFMVSVPLTYTCKAIFEKWPSEASCGFSCCPRVGSFSRRVNERRERPCRPDDVCL